MKMLPLQTGLITSLLLVSFSTLAGSLTVTNDFVSGTPAVAADVNQNFTDIETAVNDNDTRITANGGGVTTNAADIATNAGNITTNSGGISTNAGGIMTNATDIGTNATDIGTNATDIGTNATDIGTNATDIGTNAINIGTNATAITDLQQNSFACAGNDVNDEMVRVGPLCVDKYEASVWDSAVGGGTQYGVGNVLVATDDYPCNNNGSDCVNNAFARSQTGVQPSTAITWFQAQQACANSGKRLLTNAEWQMAVAGTVDPGASDGTAGVCNTGTNSGDDVRNTGGGTACVSRWGAEDMVGNVYEWVADWVQGGGSTLGTFAANASSATATGAYDSSDLAGFNTVPASGGSPGNAMPAAILRGGAFNSQGGAGSFAMRADFSPDFVGNTRIGFRCAR